MVEQPVKKKENTEFKSVKLDFKNVDQLCTCHPFIFKFQILKFNKVKASLSVLYDQIIYLNNFAIAFTYKISKILCYAAFSELVIKGKSKNDLQGSMLALVYVVLPT